ncbi:MAG: ABC transporter permease [Longimicrobiales bacterium]
MSARLIKVLLRLYPRRLRNEHGREMEETLTRRLAGLKGPPLLKSLRAVRFVVADAWAARRIPYGTARPDVTPSRRSGAAVLDALRVDGRYAVRRLAKSPAFTLVAALSLGLGIGANSAVFSVVNAFLFRTFPATNPETLVDVFMNDSGGFEYAPMSYLDYADLSTQTDVFSDVVAARTILAHAGPPDAPQLVMGEVVSGNYFPTLGTRAVVGRLFTPDDDLLPGGHPVAVLSHAFWQEKYGGSSSAIGAEIRINQRPYSVIGVAPPPFTGSFPAIRADVWVPITMTDDVVGASSAGQLDRRGSRSIFVKARLRPGVTPEQAEASVKALSRRWEEAFPDTNTDRAMTVVPTKNVSINPAVDRYLAPAAALLLSVVGLVLLVACTNLAGFLLARAEERKQEIAVRLALGATRGNLIRQLLFESTLLGLLGGVVGLVLAVWTVDLVTGFQPPLPVPINLDFALDRRVLTWTGLISVGAGLLFGLFPALQASRPELVAALKGEGSRGGRRISLRDGLVIAQVSLSILLLVGAGLFLRSLGRAQGADPGFYTGTAALVGPNLELSGYAQGEAAALQAELVDRLLFLPNVTDVALADRIPLGAQVQTTGIAVPGVIPEGNRDDFDIDFAYVSPSYFEVLEVPLLLGRSFGDSDGPDSRPVAIVSEAFVARFWPGENAVGRSVTRSGTEIGIVGVARDTKVRTLGESPRPYIYLPAAQGGGGQLGLQFVVRGTGSSGELLSTTRQVLAEADPDLVLMEAKTMEEHLALLLFPPRMAALLLSAFGALALLLAAVGLYGIVSFAVSRRTREVGIRISLGATRRSVARLLIAGGMKLVVVGTLIGLVTSVALSKLLSRFLYGAGSVDLISFVGVPLLLAAVALLAAYLPARRAGRINPIEALRGDS